MPMTPEDLFARFASLGLAVKTVEHPPLHTVEESQALRGDLPGGHTKNLFLKDKKGAFYLVVADEQAIIDMKQLHKVLGSARLSFGKPDMLMELLGVIPGSVTPFSIINDTEYRVQIVLDAAMLEHEILNYHPLVNTMTTAIHRDDLVAFIKSTGHEPRILAVSGHEEASA